MELKYLLLLSVLSSRHHHHNFHHNFHHHFISGWLHCFVQYQKWRYCYERQHSRNCGIVLIIIHTKFSRLNRKSYMTKFCTSIHHKKYSERIIKWKINKPSQALYKTMHKALYTGKWNNRLLAKRKWGIVDTLALRITLNLLCNNFVYKKREPDYGKI